MHTNKKVDQQNARIQVQKHKKHKSIFQVCFRISKTKYDNVNPTTWNKPPKHQKKITLNWVPTMNNKLQEINVLQQILVAIMHYKIGTQHY